MKTSQFRIQELQNAASKTLTLNIGEVQVRARVENTQPSVATFFELDGQPLNQKSICDSSLLLVESELRRIGYTYFLADVGTESSLHFPTVESLASLPRLDQNMKLLVEFDRFDGPISGLVECAGTNGNIYWFNWCTDSGHGETERVYSLRLIPQEQHAELRGWLLRYNELQSELHVHGASERWPLSYRQKSVMRAPSEIQSDLDQHDSTMPVQEAGLPISAWMPECMEELAAIRVIWMSGEDSAKHQQWRKEVAFAMANRDHLQMTRLFGHPPLSITEYDLFTVTIDASAGNPQLVGCDHMGQPPSEDFWLTAKHQINDLSSYLKSGNQQ